MTFQWACNFSWSMWPITACFLTDMNDLKSYFFFFTSQLIISNTLSCVTTDCHFAIYFFKTYYRVQFYFWKKNHQFKTEADKMQWKHLLYMFASVFLPELEHIVWLMQKCMNAAWEGVNSGQISPLQEHYLVRGQWETVWHDIVIINHFLLHKDTSHNVCCSRDTVFVKLFNSKIKNDFSLPAMRAGKSPGHFSMPLCYLLANRRRGHTMACFGKKKMSHLLLLLSILFLLTFYPFVQQLEWFLVLPQPIHAWTISQGTEAEMPQRRLEGCRRSSFSREITNGRDQTARERMSACRHTVSVWGFSCRSYDHTIEGDWVPVGDHFVK